MEKGWFLLLYSSSVMEIFFIIVFPFGGVGTISKIHPRVSC